MGHQLMAHGTGQTGSRPQYTTMRLLALTHDDTSTEPYSKTTAETRGALVFKMANGRNRTAPDKGAGGSPTLSPEIAIARARGIPVKVQ